MKTPHLGILLIVILIIVRAFVWWWSRTPVAIKPADEIMVLTTSKAYPSRLIRTNATGATGQIFGKASLSEAEKETLRKRLPRDEKGAYEKGIICLKHRLSKIEILELIRPANLQRTTETGTTIAYQVDSSVLLVFKFDKNDNLKEAKLANTRIQLPSLESVSTNTTP